MMLDLEHKDEVLSNLDPQYAADSPQLNILALEVRGLRMPFEILGITERCDELSKLLKIVKFQLSFNVMQHSEQFIEGTNYIKGIEQDLAAIRELGHGSKTRLQHLRSSLVLRSMRILKLERRKRRLVYYRDLVVKVLRRVNEQYKHIISLEFRGEFADALELAKAAIADLRRLTEGEDVTSRFVSLRRMQARLESLRTRVSG